MGNEKSNKHTHTHESDQIRMNAKDRVVCTKSRKATQTSRISFCKNEK